LPVEPLPGESVTLAVPGMAKSTDPEIEPVPVTAAPGSSSRVPPGDTVTLPPDMTIDPPTSSEFLTTITVLTLRVVPCAVVLGPFRYKGAGNPEPVTVKLPAARFSEPLTTSEP